MAFSGLKLPRIVELRCGHVRPSAVERPYSVFRLTDISRHTAGQMLNDGGEFPDPHLDHLQVALDHARHAGPRPLAPTVADIDGRYGKASQRQPFLDSLMGLYDEIEAEEKQRESQRAERSSPSQIEKFMKRWKGKEKGTSPDRPR